MKNLDQVAEQARKVLDVHAPIIRRRTNTGWGSAFVQWSDLDPQRQQGWRALVKHVADVALEDVAKTLDPIGGARRICGELDVLREVENLVTENVALRKKVAELEADYANAKEVHNATRKELGAQCGETLPGAAFRVVKERDQARHETVNRDSLLQDVAESLARESNAESGGETLQHAARRSVQTAENRLNDFNGMHEIVLEARTTLGAQPGEPLAEACKRVVNERDKGRQVTVTIEREPAYNDLEFSILLHALADVAAAKEDAEARLAMAQRTIEKKDDALKKIHNLAAEQPPPQMHGVLRASYPTPSTHKWVHSYGLVPLLDPPYARWGVNLPHSAYSPTGRAPSSSPELQTFRVPSPLRR